MGQRRSHLVAVVLLLAVLAACNGSNPLTERTRDITIADLTGLSEDHALRLVDNLDLHVEVERISPTEPNEQARNVVLRQAPPAGTQVPAGSTLTLFVPEERPLAGGEEPFRLLTHCGLSFPLMFDDMAWLPVDKRLRRTINPPDGFASDGFYDKGTIRRVDADTLIYTSSMGIEVEYEPTRETRDGCD